MLEDPADPGDQRRDDVAGRFVAATVFRVRPPWGHNPRPGREAVRGNEDRIRRRTNTRLRVRGVGAAAEADAVALIGLEADEIVGGTL